MSSALQAPMFTGIVKAVGSLESLRRDGGGARIRMRVPAAWHRRLRLGDSIAVNGCCLTVAGRDRGSIAADLTTETLARTALARLQPKAPLNLEPPLRAGDPLGGHIMQGHIEGTGRIMTLAPVRPSRERDATGGWLLKIGVPAPLLPFVTLKGTLAVDGISLTVAWLRAGVAGFAIVPFTMAHTNLRSRQPGDYVNLETDPMAHHAARLGKRSRLTLAELKRQGF